MERRTGVDEVAQVWITRTGPFGEETRAALARQGISSLLRPLLRVRALPASDLPNSQALVFTSRNAVRLFAAAHQRRAGAVFTVGDATRDEALAAGFRDVLSAGGDVNDLGALILEQANHGIRTLVHPCARQSAGELNQVLGAAGFEYRPLPIYEILAAPSPPADSPLRRLGVRAVLLHSPKAARRFAALAQDGPLAPGAVLVCLSNAVQRACLTAGRRSVVASEPTEAAIQDALLRLFQVWPR